MDIPLALTMDSHFPTDYQVIFPHMHPWDFLMDPPAGFPKDFPEASLWIPLYMFPNIFTYRILY